MQAKPRNIKSSLKYMIKPTQKLIVWFLLNLHFLLFTCTTWLALILILGLMNCAFKTMITIILNDIDNEC